MHFLLVHQNFPGQFRDLAPRLVSLGHRVTAIASKKPAPCLLPEAIQVCVYPWSQPEREGTLIDLNLEVNLRRGAKVLLDKDIKFRKILDQNHGNHGLS